MASYSLRGRDMADKQENNPSSGSCSSPPMQAKDAGQTEQFPAFNLQRKASQKSKSLTAAEMATEMIDQDRATAIDRMKSESPPLSLDQVRQRRVSVKESARDQRKASIDLIRSRTASRASVTTRPNLEEITRSD